MRSGKNEMKIKYKFVRRDLKAAVNFIYTLQAAFAKLFLRKKITKPNLKRRM